MDGKVWVNAAPEGLEFSSLIVDEGADRVFVIGSDEYSVGFQQRETVELYEFREGEWVHLKTLDDRNESSSGYPMVLVIDGEIYIRDASGLYPYKDYKKFIEHEPDGRWWETAQVSFSNGAYIAATDRRVYVSKDGSNWENQGGRINGWDETGRIHYGNGFYMSRSQVGPALSLLRAHGRAFGDVVFFNGYFFAFTGDRVLRSTDGAAWVEASLGVPWFGFSYFAKSEDRLVLSTHSGVAATTDGINWEVGSQPSQSELVQLSYWDGSFYGLASGRIYRSSDGISWASTGSINHPEAGFGIDNFGISDGVFYAVTSNRATFTSTNGQGWVYVGRISLSDFVEDGEALLARTAFGWGIVGSPADRGIVGGISNIDSNVLVSEGSGVAIEVESVSFEGDVVSVRVFIDDVLWRELLPSERRFEFEADGPGVYQLKVEFENENGEVTSDTRVIQVAPKIYTSVPGSDNWFYDTVEFNGAVYGVGVGGRIYQSLDGIEWKGVQTPIVELFERVVANDDVIVAVAPQAGLAYSDDGAEWTFIDVPVDRDLILAGGLFVGNEILSLDGVSWFSTSTGEKLNGVEDFDDSVEYVSTEVMACRILVVLGVSPSASRRFSMGIPYWVGYAHQITNYYIAIIDRALWWSENLESWTRVSGFDFELNSSWKIEKIGDKHFILNEGQSVAFASDDGLVWQGIEGVDLIGLVENYSGSYYSIARVGSGHDGPIVSLACSEDGVSWTPFGESWDSFYSTRFNDLTVSNAGFALLSKSGTGEELLRVSQNGSNWTRTVINPVFNFEGVALYGDEDLLAVIGQRAYAQAANGEWDWVSSVVIEKAAELNGRFVGIWNGDVFLGANRTSWSAASPPNWMGGPQYVFSDGEQAFWMFEHGLDLGRSVDGINWERRSLPADTDFFEGVFFFKNKLYLKTDNGRLYTGTDDGRNWTQVTISESFTLSIVRTEDLIGAALEGNRFLTSSDGLNWIERSLPAEATNEVYRDMDYFYSVGESVWRSADGIAWEQYFPYKVKLASSGRAIQLYDENLAFIDLTKNDVGIVDAEIQATEFAPGNSVSLELSLRNFGSEPIATSSLGAVDLVLSKSKGPFGRPDAGSGMWTQLALDSTVIAPGQTATFSQSFSVPDDISPGDFYLKTRLNNDMVSRDGNSVNDFYFSEGIAVSVEGFRLNLELNGEGEVLGFDGDGMYAKGSDVQLVAKAAFGFEFDQWTGAVAQREEVASLTMDQDYSLVGTFMPRVYAVDISSGRGGSITGAPGTGQAEFGDQISLTATPEEGWLFLGWKGDINSSQSTIDLSVGRDIELFAQFGQTYES